MQNTSSIEDLSNELFYEIFNYLDGCQIHHAFLYLNYRFRQLINSSSFLFKIKFSSTIDNHFVDDYNQILFSNRQQIYSLNLRLSSNSNGFFLLNTINSSLNHLESLSIFSITSTILIPLLPNLKSLPRLYSLTIEMLSTTINLSEIYQVIFTLQMLKYFKLSIYNNSISKMSLPRNTNKQVSIIEHLVINHHFHFIDLSDILSYTPQIRHLNLMKSFYYYSLYESVRSTIWPTMTHFSMCLTDGMFMFECFEVLISKTSSELKVFSFNTCSQNSDYLDAFRWENLISKYMPQLEKFYFQYSEYADNHDNTSIDFTSSFCTKRKWMFEVEINVQNVIYSIHPYRKQWYTQHDMITNSCSDLSESIHLTLSHITHDKYNNFITSGINHVLNRTQIYHLEIVQEKIYIGTLIQITNSLLELRSLKIHSLSLHHSRNLNSKEIGILYSIHYTSKITKVNLKHINELEEIHFLLDFCPYMSYLKIGGLHTTDVPSYVRTILKKTSDTPNSYLNSLCFYIPTVDEKMINNLNKMIDNEKLLLDYKLNCIFDKIYLQWKLLE